MYFTVHHKMGYKTYDFESNDMFYAYAFLKILKRFHLNALDSYIQDWDVCQIRFSTHPQTREKIECCYRRMIQAERCIITDDVSYRDTRRRIEEDGYAIY